MRKFHAYPILLVAIGSLTLSALSGSAAMASTDSAQVLKRTSFATASVEQRKAGPAAQKTLLNLLGKSSLSNKAAVCGDSEPDAGEECDDGNTVSGDGCDATCLVEAGSACTTAIAGSAIENLMLDGSFEDDPTTAWTFTSTLFGPRCTLADCNNDLASDGAAYLWMTGGDVINTNSASATQSLVIPAKATTLTFEWAVFTGAADCENLTDFLEVTIDGVQVFRTADPCAGATGIAYTTVAIDLTATGANVNDGLSHTVVLNAAATETDETLWTNFFIDNVRVDVLADPPIEPVPSSCFVGACGDGVLASGEICDDGNSIAGDGCSATCTVEADFVCSDPLYDGFDFLPTGAAPTADAITEGSLEDRRGRPSSAWTEDRVGATDLLPICSEVFCPFISVNIASDGIFYALFGASIDPSDTSISQTTTIPVGANTLTFDFFAATPAAGACDSGDDFLEVTIDGFQVYLYDCVTPIEEYTQQTADITAFADGLEHEITVRGVTLSTNAQNTNFFADNFSIAVPGIAPIVASSCFERDTACDTIETFDSGIPATWTVVNLGLDVADGWGNNGDGTCLAENAAPLADFNGSDNLTTGSGGVACADSDATGQVDAEAAGTPENPDPAAALEMDTYLCSPALDLSTITGPSFSFNTFYASANNQLNENGTPDDFTDDFDEDLLEVLIGTNIPNQLTAPNYTRLGSVNDHEDGNVILTGAQELSANLVATELEGASKGYVCFHYKGTYAWFAQIDNAGLRGEDCSMPPPDSDGDGVLNSIDNCTLVANPLQEDTNGDGIGNRCDADVNNDCFVNFLDIALFPAKFNSVEGDPAYDADFDLNSSGSINFQDFFFFRDSFNTEPGPSANACVPGLGN